ncbi:hypothetical protein J5J83_03890 [Azoarcus sp. L1K30]|uniref:putative metalloprotease CJM1_0395 family protein n=1 Tax=Azoarcus sp. L1K30 TaxID=2820277 RepID=UPI001B831977|nr:putative metalloprotease CJM1_0395 family protein [Azoarcus sp. L1K30]MBR0565258.1 hypothetical protein [Azoarcus sp. L1K30]
MISAGIGGATHAYWPQLPASSQGKASESNKRIGNDAELSAAEQRELDQLKQRDEQVRAHEQAHISAGGDLITARASYTFETGPDDKRYAVGGEVRIDTSEGRTAEETIARAERIRAAALAPTDPSPQDRQVATMAQRMASEARQELNAQRGEDDPIAARLEAALSRLVEAVSAAPQQPPAIDVFA